MQKTDVKSTLTTNQDIIQLALVLWSNADLLNRNVTSANVDVQPYPFTTQSLFVGYAFKNNLSKPY